VEPTPVRDATGPTSFVDEPEEIVVVSVYVYYF